MFHKSYKFKASRNFKAFWDTRRRRNNSRRRFHNNYI